MASISAPEVTPPPSRLLIVDDEAAQMRALCETLKLEGYVTQGFSSAREALATLNPGDFDLLVTDLMMPQMDGIALINAAQERDRELAAIVMTGHGTIDTAVRAMQGGALDYVLKPFKLNTILPVIARALAMRRMRQEIVSLHLLEARQAAELAQAYQDLESFSYSISHDLRAPLRTITAFSQALEEDFGQDLKPEAQNFVRIIRSGSVKMDEMIVGLLEFSRIGRSVLQRAAVDMNALAHEVAADAKAHYAHLNPLLEIDDLPSVEGDALALRQVWSNLIGNALKYSAKRAQPQVRVSGRRAAGEAIYEVRDNGAGFDMRYAQNLFGVFQRLHRNDEFPGSGVGLAIVHRIVARHGGRTWAESAPDRGARFHFALPAPSPPSLTARSSGKPS